MIYGSKWCGCRDRCAEEDTLYQRPNERGSCQMYAPGNDRSPVALAQKIFEAMTQQERDTAKEYGAGDMEERIREEAPGWDRGDLARCLNEIDKLCGYEDANE